MLRNRGQDWILGQCSLSYHCARCVPSREWTAGGRSTKLNCWYFWIRVVKKHDYLSMSSMSPSRVGFYLDKHSFFRDRGLNQFHPYFLIKLAKTKAVNNSTCCGQVGQKITNQTPQYRLIKRLAAEWLCNLNYLPNISFQAISWPWASLLLQGQREDEGNYEPVLTAK